MKSYRKQLIICLFEISKMIYTRLFKTQKPWGLKKTDLLSYPEHSLGKHLGLFLDKNNFELIPKVERHDVYHVVTDYGIKVEDEIALQYLSFGNGKRSLYLFGSIILGTCILPDYLNYYIKSYRIGKSANIFHNLNFKKMLNVSIRDLKSTIFLKSNYFKRKTS